MASTSALLTTASLVSALHNMHSATLHPSAINSYISTELQERKLFSPGSILGLHFSLMGMVLKGHVLSIQRLITNRSHSEEGEGIQAELCSIRYALVEAAAVAALMLGPGSTSSKLNIKSAYQPVLIHPYNGHLVGVEWQGACYVDGALLFGLQLAPEIFTALTNARQCMPWIVLSKLPHCSLS